MTTYPLPCGCKGPTYYALCDDHKSQHLSMIGQMMGLPDLLVELDPSCPASVQLFLDKVGTAFIESGGRPLNIKLRRSS